MPNDQYDLTVGEVADLLHVHPDTVRRWSSLGRLHAWTTPGGQRRYRRSDVEALLPHEPAADPDRAAS